MNELFLSYLWKYRLLGHDIQTDSGEPVAVIHPGDGNTDSGPDFFNARLRIGPTLWAGNVEIHVRASDWYRHGHHHDPAYDRVILHVVYDADQAVLHPNGVPVPMLVVRDHIPAGIFERYQRMMHNPQWIPCSSQLDATAGRGFGMWAPALALERLENKSSAIRQLLAGCSNDWEEAMYRHMAGSFGFKVNAMPFEMLAKSLPLKVLRKHCGNLFQLEALLFGQAGMLTGSFSDAYPRSLITEYDYLSKKYMLTPLTSPGWKFLRLRPTNFPTIRISQFAAFLLETRARFFALFGQKPFPLSRDLFARRSSEYWDSHYVFDKHAGYRPKTMGESCINLVIVNGLSPFLFCYGLEKGKPDICEAVLAFLETVPGEKNSITERWRAAGFPTDNSLLTQSLIHLKQSYCDRKRCLECRIGSTLLV
jgi:hypothetical protein